MKNCNLNLNYTYIDLPITLYSKVVPDLVSSPELIIFNHDLSNELNLDFLSWTNKEMANLFSGKILPKNSTPFSQAYAGHQFGYFSILGDGRAIIIGEHKNLKKKKFDIQFKGSGKTPYSRNGDGKATLSSMLREYLISEAMHNLGIKTTRSLAVVSTGDLLFRHKEIKGGILTRVASSHLRIGTFQYAAIQKNSKDILRKLSIYTIKRHYPELVNLKNPVLGLIHAVMQSQIELIIDWIRVGFIHGVMNTDNVAVSGETIDYGPCAFINEYDPSKSFSSIDHNGRYSFGNQPTILKWNMARFIESLLKIIDDDETKSIKYSREILDQFDNIYRKKWLEMMKSKLGILGHEENDMNLIFELLAWMKKYNSDYTNTFCYLMNKKVFNSKIFINTEFLKWKKKWEIRLCKNSKPFKYALKIMKKNNPLIIPRNHIVERVLKEFEEKNVINSFIEFNKILKSPYQENSNLLKYQNTLGTNEGYQTYCGT